MAEIQRGAGVVWGITSTGFNTGTAYTSSQWLPQSEEAGREADSEETRDGAGEVINRTTFNQRQTLSLTIIPSGTTIANAKTASVLPTPGSELKVIDTDANVGAGSPGTSYEVQSSQLSKTNTGKATITVVLGRWAGLGSYAQLS